MKIIKTSLLAGLMAASSLATAQTALLGDGNVGITAFSAAFVGSTITLNETWGASGPGSVIFRGLDTSVNYTVVKNITNSTGANWTSFANELLPNGPGIPGQPGFIPGGYQPSNNLDGLSFAQGAGLPRTSSFFGNLFVDELAGRDYIDFAGGIWAAGAVGSMTFGLLAQNTTIQPFLLFQRPNERTNVIPVPAALPLLLSGLGIFAFMARRRKNA